MEKTITVKARSDVRKSQRGRAYFTLTDLEDINYVCFVASQHPDFEPGSAVKADVTEREGQDPTIKLAEGGVGPKPTSKPSYSNRDEDRTDTRTAIMKIGDLWIAGKLAEDNALILALKVWLLAATGITQEQITEEAKKWKNPLEKQG